MLEHERNRRHAGEDGAEQQRRVIPRGKREGCGQQHPYHRQRDAQPEQVAHQRFALGAVADGVLARADIRHPGVRHHRHDPHEREDGGVLAEANHPQMAGEQRGREDRQPHDPHIAAQAKCPAAEHQPARGVRVEHVDLAAGLPRGVGLPRSARWPRGRIPRRRHDRARSAPAVAHRAAAHARA